MRDIKGSVCIARFRDGYGQGELLFGKRMNKLQNIYENFQVNNLTPYETIGPARKAYEKLTARIDFSTAQLGHLEMKVAETLDEIKFLQSKNVCLNSRRIQSIMSLKNKKSLVVIMLTESSQKVLIGPIVKGGLRFGGIPAAFLYDNGFRTFDSFERAEYIGQEVNRQARLPINMATFKLKRI